MNGTHIYRRFAAVLGALFFLMTCNAPAYADRPDDAKEKGTALAGTTELDREHYVDPNEYEQEPIEIPSLLIGLDFGENALYDAAFVNANRQGFYLCRYDEAREFQPYAQTEANELHVCRLWRWHALLDQRFGSLDDARKSAQRVDGLAFTLDGEARVLVGSFDSEEKAAEEIEKRELKAKPWQDRASAVFDGSWQILDLIQEPAAVAFSCCGEGETLCYHGGEGYRGAFLLRPTGDGRFTVINVVSLEDYVKGVIPYEMNSLWPFEALRAQAVCARSYAAGHLNEYAEDYGFDLTNDTQSQVYRGVAEADEVTDAAVDSTAGLFVRYEGRLCEVYYFASDGGATEDGNRIFGVDQPYLAGKTDPFEQAVDRQILRWERWRSGEDIARALSRLGYEIGTVADVNCVYSELGNVVGMNYTDEEGRTLRLETRDAYKFLSLNSARFYVERDEDGDFVFRGVGFGHNCGMSQWGAYAMADSYGYDCEDIIRFYFTGAYVA